MKHRTPNDCCSEDYIWHRAHDGCFSGDIVSVEYLGMDGRWHDVNKSMAYYDHRISIEMENP